MEEKYVIEKHIRTIKVSLYVLVQNLTVSSLDKHKKSSHIINNTKIQSHVLCVKRKQKY